MKVMKEPCDNFCRGFCDFFQKEVKCCLVTAIHVPVLVEYVHRIGLDMTLIQTNVLFEEFKSVEVMAQH